MKPNLQRRVKRYSTLYIFLLPAIISVLIFYYRPMQRGSLNLDPSNKHGSGAILNAQRSK